MSVRKSFGRVTLLLVSSLLLGSAIAKQVTAGPGLSGTISVTADVIRPVGVSGARLPDTAAIQLPLGSREGPSARHRELILWPGGAREVLIQWRLGSESIVAQQHLCQTTGKRPESECTWLVCQSDGATIVTVIPIGQ